MVKNSNPIVIRKASGEEETFDATKLQRSLRKAGTDEEIIDEIVDNINNWIFPGANTKQIYSRAFSILKKKRSGSSIRYRLKKAIFELGPSGYPFEDFIGQVFKQQGYQVDVGIVLEGNCVTHEMDVIATKDGRQHLMECKYHKDQGKQVSVQVPLYVRSRVNDIIEHRKKSVHYKDLNFEGWVVTNTRFTSDSLAYSKCSGLNLLAWDYPSGNGLKDLIEKLNIYPVTILHKLTRKEKQHLLLKGIVTCSQLKNNAHALDDLELSQSKLKSVISELEALLE